ncbi:MAG: TlpA family protein disulfide reductase [Saprospiraceae bacterium]|nr:TlpA family protein disulfide reductase [Saprospiraceae bacterium]
MKLGLYSFFISVGFLCLLSCGAQNSINGTDVKGEFKNASGLNIFIDKIQTTSQNMPLMGQATLDGSGKFSFNIPTGLAEGIYRIRLGQKVSFVVFDGTEKSIDMNGDYNDLDKFQYSIKGSSTASDLLTNLGKFYRQEIDANAISAKALEAKNPLVGMQIALQTLPPTDQFMPVHKKLATRLNQELPKSEFGAYYNQLIGSIEAQMQQQKAQDLVQVGQEAPDIQLPDLSGKMRSLKSLKGKVVLLDFWASWCGPCRKENPNVVNVYNKYKSKGFEVFSVSLDGLDKGTRQAMAADPAQLEANVNSSKERWRAAIQQDGLVWENHVSDLMKWDCAPGRTYGVSSIPKTFILDRNGKIAAINARGAALEAEVVKLLN